MKTVFLFALFLASLLGMMGCKKAPVSKPDDAPSTVTWVMATGNPVVTEPPQIIKAKVAAVSVTKYAYSCPKGFRLVYRQKVDGGWELGRAAGLSYVFQDSRPLDEPSDSLFCVLMQAKEGK